MRSKIIKQAIKLYITEIRQKGNIFYTGKIKASDLLSIATLHWRGTSSNKKNKYLDEVRNKLQIKESEEGIQRIIESNRIEKISRYLRDDGFIPNSIIISINNKETDDESLSEEIGDAYIAEETAIPGIYELIIYPEFANAFIVDGQHRLASFLKAEELIDEYELVVTIFLEMAVPLQAELFSVINGNQKPVNKSLLYDLTEFNEDEYNEIKRCHAIAKFLNSKLRSPFYNKINMLGSGINSISQSAFIDELRKYVKNRSRDEYKSFLKDNTHSEITSILLSYFTAISETLDEAWGNTQDYMLLKATGFGACMKLLYPLFLDFAIKRKPFKKIELIPIFKKIDVELFSTESVGRTGGQGLQLVIYRKLMKKIFGIREDSLAIRKFIKELEEKFMDQ